MDEAQHFELTLIFIVIGLVMTLLAVAIVLFVLYYRQRMLRVKSDRQQQDADYRESLLEASLQSQETERSRIARDLHDGVGALLSTVRLNLSMAQLSEDAQDFDHLKSMVDDSIESIRRISRDLLPRTLAELGLSAALKELARNLDKGGNIRTDLDLHEVPRLEEARELAIYRMAQEFVNNAIKHAEPSLIHIALKAKDNELHLELSDDGRGFDLSQHSSGLGLKNLESRANFIKGKWTLHSALGHGTQGLLIVPIHEERPFDQASKYPSDL